MKSRHPIRWIHHLQRGCFFFCFCFLLCYKTNTLFANIRPRGLYRAKRKRYLSFPFCSIKVTRTKICKKCLFLLYYHSYGGLQWIIFALILRHVQQYKCDGGDTLLPFTEGDDIKTMTLWCYGPDRYFEYRSLVCTKLKLRNNLDISHEFRDISPVTESCLFCPVVYVW